MKSEKQTKKETKKKLNKSKETKLKEKITELEEKLEEAEEKILRTRAEYDNYRKRSFRELTDARTLTKADTIIPVLNVFDHFKMAVEAAEQSDDLNVLREGMKMINMEFAKAIDDFGLEEINAVGEKFDPNLHEAVAQESSNEEEDIVIKQWRCGYKLGERLLRPATVVVSTGPEKTKPENEEN